MVHEKIMESSKTPPYFYRVDKTSGLLRSIETEFISIRNETKAPEMERYLRNQFKCYGISALLRKPITQKVSAPFKSLPAQEQDRFMRICWEKDQREWQYLAIDLYRKALSKSSVSRIEMTLDLIQHKSWWDTVDSLASNCFGKLLMMFPDEKEEFLQRCINSDYMWLNRTAIIHQLTYKQHTDTEWLIKSILPHINSKDFFIQKGIGWALRQYAKTDSNWVVSFVENHTCLSNLSKKEALKHIN